MKKISCLEAPSHLYFRVTFLWLYKQKIQTKLHNHFVRAYYSICNSFRAYSTNFV